MDRKKAAGRWRGEKATAADRIFLGGHNAREMNMTDYRVPAGESQEDQVTAAIEQYTSKTPSSAFLAVAVAAIGASLACKAMGKDHASLFVGQWVAPILLLGIYNKMVKQHGSDASMRGLR